MGDLNRRIVGVLMVIGICLPAVSVLGQEIVLMDSQNTYTKSWNFPGSFPLGIAGDWMAKGWDQGTPTVTLRSLRKIT